MLYGFPAYWDVFSDWTFKTKRARRNHTNHILLFTCNIAREEALLLMLDSSQAKKSHCRACSRATCNTSHKLLVPKLACQQTFFLARKDGRNTSLRTSAREASAVNKSPAVLCCHKSKQRFCEQGIYTQTGDQFGNLSFPVQKMIP